MQLISLKYSQFNDQPNAWDLDELTLGNLNLIVGKNASGKTKTLNIIRNLASCLCGDIKPTFIPANFSLKFKNGKEIIEYKLRTNEGSIVHEELAVDGTKKILRNEDGTGKIYAEIEKKDLEFKIPLSDLAFTAKRDLMQHAYLEPLVHWADSVRYYAFGSSLGKHRFFGDDYRKSDVNPKDPMNVVPIFIEGKENFPAFKPSVLEDMKKIGYDLVDIDAALPSFTTHILQGNKNILGLWVQEKNLQARTEQIEISQGMFRALSLIIQLNYSALAKQPSCILIDDIGEGLDFDRSCALIQLLMEKVKNTAAQLIMTTNDRFVMNKVPLDVWTVLSREGPRCQVYNIHNSKEVFENFRFTGLSNFDFLATDYISSSVE